MTRTPLKRKSIIEAIALLKLREAWTAGGASGEAAGIWLLEPMCMLTTVPVSWQTAKNGSQWPEWIDGSPRWVGISEKVTALTPRAALRRISATARSMSQSGMMQSGISRPPLSPHHSSTIQSL